MSSDKINEITLFPGIVLARVQLWGEEACLCHHDTLADMMEINYCHQGRMGWNMKNGQSIYLGPGDFSIHTQSLCAGSVMTLPNGYYSGIILYIDVRTAQEQLPALLSDCGVSLQSIQTKFCAGSAFSVFTGNEKNAPIFEGFYVKEEAYQQAYDLLKTMELLLYLSRMDAADAAQPNRYQSEQVEIIKQIHNYLVENLDRRITIDALAGQFALNTTTVKTVFKAVYGESIAYHIKAHRMEKAAELLAAGDDSIASVAHAVGYSSPGKFSASFQETYQMLPLEYRKLHRSSASPLQ